MSDRGTGERPFADIITSTRYWLIHIPALLLLFSTGFLFVSTGLAYDAFGTPRPSEYYNEDGTKKPLISDRYQSKEQLDKIEKGEK